MNDVRGQRDNVQSDLRDWLAMHIYISDELAGNIYSLYRSCLHILFPTYPVGESDKVDSIIFDFKFRGSMDPIACLFYKCVVHAVINENMIAR